LTAGDVYRALWRYSALIVALTAACVLTAWYVASEQTKTYEASTLLRFQFPPRPDAESELDAFEAGERLALAYADVVDSGAIDERVRRIAVATAPQLGDSSIDLSADELDGLEMMRVFAQSDDPATAALVANAVPKALRGLIRDTDASRASVVVVRPASNPDSPVAPRVGLTLAVAALLALIFNGALALLLEVFRDRLPEPEELEDVAGTAVLATVPTLRLHRLDSDEPEATERRDAPEVLGRSGAAPRAVSTLRLHGLDSDELKATERRDAPEVLRRSGAAPRDSRESRR
jgi:polysaccharide biosynthesis transport protein